MLSYLDEENTSRAAMFVTDWRCQRRYDGMPVRVALPVITGRMTTSVTGEQILEVIDGHSEADVVLRSKQKQSSLFATCDIS